MTRRTHARQAFTLIETLVVIFIIAILVSLVAPAVQRSRAGGLATQARSDISQLDLACGEFNRKFGFYPPSTFTIPTRIDQPGYTVFKQMFPRWNPPVQSDNVTIVAASQPANAGSVLSDGNRCLVYFLGGPNGTGWAVDAPIAPSTGAAAKTVFMDFPVNRLTSTPLGQYLDPWGVPFAYFASTAGGNYPAASFTYNNAAGSTTTVFPYTRSGKPVNQGGVQIISAGPNGDRKNGGFGPGGAWAPGTGNYSNPASAGGDDLANFNAGKPLSTD